MCVQDVDARCVLQFTLIHAAGCALHRRTSRVIHRLELCYAHTRACVRSADATGATFRSSVRACLMSQSFTVRSVRRRATLGDERVEAATEETVTAPSQTGDQCVSRDCLATRPAHGCAENRARALRLFEPSLTRATRVSTLLQQCGSHSSRQAAPPNALRRRSAVRYLDGSLTPTICVLRWAPLLREHRSHSSAAAGAQGGRACRRMRSHRRSLALVLRRSDDAKRLCFSPSSSTCCCYWDWRERRATRTAAHAVSADEPKTTTRERVSQRLPSDRVTRESRSDARQKRCGFGNDPSAGSPTETLLRLLLPLSEQV